MMSVNFGPVVTPRMGMRMKPGFRAPQRPQPLGGLQMAKLSVGGMPHDAPMSYVSRVDALHGMPMHTLPDYMMSRMADGGMAEHPMVERYRRRRLERRFPQGISAHMEPIDTLEQTLSRLPPGDMDRMMSMQPEDQQRLMGDVEGRYVDDLRGERKQWNPVLDSARDRQRRALSEISNAGPLDSMRARETREQLNDIGYSFADPTMLPFFGAGMASRFAPRLFRPMPRLPWKGRAGEFAGWGASGPNVGDLTSGGESLDRPWGLDDSQHPLIGD